MAVVDGAHLTSDDWDISVRGGERFLGPPTFNRQGGQPDAREVCVMTNPIDSTVSVPVDLCDALDRVRPMMAQLSKAELLRVNLDPWAAVALVRGALPNLLRMRPVLANPICSFDVADLDFLETYTLALTQAEAVFRTVSSKQEQLPVILDEGFEVRARMVQEANVLVHRGLLSAARLTKLSVPNGYRNIGADLLILIRVLRDGWSKRANLSAIQSAELDYAASLADKLICGIALRARTTAEAAAAADDRQRAFTLFVRAYSEVRWVVRFLRRHEGDVEKIAPSLYGRRKPRRKRRATTDVGQVEHGKSGAEQSQPAPKESNDSSVSNNIDDPFMH
jgi:hypothetical protein